MLNFKLIPCLGCCALALPGISQARHRVEKPNVIFIYADDMGMGMLSCMGQKEFETPNIDHLFHQGTQFDHAYACMVSAASRASLLTGYYDVRKEKVRVSGGGALLFDPATMQPSEIEAVEARIDARDVVLPEGDYYLPQVFQQAGYVTGQIGKLEYGWTATRQQLRRHGWDQYYGYLDHVACHGYYPPYVFENGEIVMIEGNTRKNCAKTLEPETDAAYADRWNREGKQQYAQDLFDTKIKDFIRENKDRPFFLYHPTLLPHGPVMIPEVHPAVKNNPRLTQIEKEYASMVLRLDSVVGMILEEVERQGIAGRTLIVFASDNGHEIYYAQKGRVSKPFGRYNDWNRNYYSAAHGDVFNGNAGMRGFKRLNSDGGIRVPMAVYAPGMFPAGVHCPEFVSICDWIPTFAEILDVPLSEKYRKDGVSIWKTMTKGRSLPAERYIVYSSYYGPAIVTNQGLKVRYNTFAKDYDLYNVLEDPQERKNIASEMPEEFARLKALLIRECDGNIEKGICQY